MFVLKVVWRVGGGSTRTQQQITEEEIENIRAYYGFDKPALTRYFEWLGKVVRFDLGTSYFYEEPGLGCN